MSLKDKILSKTKELATTNISKAKEYMNENTLSEVADDVKEKGKDLAKMALAIPLPIRSGKSLQARVGRNVYAKRQCNKLVSFKR